MKVLGIDTSGYANAIGVVDGERVLVDLTFEARTDTLQKIVSNIDSTLKRASLGLADIDGFGVGLGPGSWTGIRVGVTVGKMLAFSTSKPVCGVSTLDVLAGSAGNTETPVCSIIDAGARDMVYAAFYRHRNDGLSREGEYYVGDIAGLSRLISGPVVLVGDGARRYHQQLSGGLVTPGITITALEAVPRGSMVARLAEGHLRRGERDDALSLAPLYLKESTARVFRNKYMQQASGKRED